MLVHLASGGTTAMEDAAVLGECLDWAQSPSDLRQATLAYQAIQKPRCEKIQDRSRENAGGLSMPDGPAQQSRDQMYEKQMQQQDEELALGEAERRARPKARPDMDAPFGDPSFFQWLYRYDAVEEVRAC